MLSSISEQFCTFLGVEIQVPAEAGPPHAVPSPRSTQGGGAVGLPDTYFSITKPLDTERAKSQMFYACLLLKHRTVCLCPLYAWSDISIDILGQKHQQQCVTCFTPYRETLKYTIHLFAVIPLNQG